MSNITLLYITFPSKKVAKQISRHLLKKRLIACANLCPIESMYWWEGKRVEEKEWALLVKTRKTLYAAVKKAVEKLHPYEIPCILRIPAEANAPYAAWIQKETKS